MRASPSMQGAVYSVKEGLCRKRKRKMIHLCLCVHALSVVSCLLGAQAMREQMDPFLVQTLQRMNEAAVN